MNIRKYDLWGITNGIDIESWNPMTDPQVPYNFNKVNVKKAKAFEQRSITKRIRSYSRSGCHVGWGRFPTNMAEGILLDDGKTF